MPYSFSHETIASISTPPTFHSVDQSHYDNKSGEQIDDSSQKSPEKSSSFSDRPSTKSSETSDRKRTSHEKHDDRDKHRSGSVNRARSRDRTGSGSRDRRGSKERRGNDSRDRSRRSTSRSRRSRSRDRRYGSLFLNFEDVLHSRMYHKFPVQVYFPFAVLFFKVIQYNFISIQH